MKNAYLAHHGVKGQKWGQRRYQEPDGTRTPAGEKKHRESTRRSRRLEKRFNRVKEGLSKAAVGAAGLAGAAALAYGSVQLTRIGLGQTTFKEVGSIIAKHAKGVAVSSIKMVQNFPYEKAGRLAVKTAKLGGRAAKYGGKLAVKGGKKAIAVGKDVLTDEHKRNIAVGAGLTAGGIYAVNKAKKAKERLEKYASGETPSKHRPKTFVDKMEDAGKRQAVGMALTYANPKTWLKKNQPVSYREQLKQKAKKQVRAAAGNYIKRKVKKRIFGRDFDEQ